MKAYGSIRFEREDISRLFGLTVRRETAYSADVDCPFCHYKKGKMNVNWYKNAFRCNICEESGSLIELHQRLNCLSDKETARRRIRERIPVTRCDVSLTFSPKRKLVPPSQKADRKVIHDTFSGLIQCLGLRPEHKQALLDRGLTEEQIERYRYRSVPMKGMRNISQSLAEDGYILKGVPGFYQCANGEWSLCFGKYNAGILIPVIGADGLIAGAQIRLDHPKDGRKYIWFSSGYKEGGTGSGSPVSVNGDLHRETVIVTEGYLKATIAHCLSGETFIGTGGVNQLKNLEGLLKLLPSYGVKRVYEADDMDKKLPLVCLGDYDESCAGCEFRNGLFEVHDCPRKRKKQENIERGRKRLVQMCIEHRLECKSLVWDLREDGLWAGHYKGIDDFWAAKQKERKEEQ